MDYDKLIERLYQHNKDYGEGRTQDFFRVCLDCKDAATAIATLRADLARVTAERDAIERDFRAFTKQWWEEANGFPCRFCKFENSGGCEQKAKHPNDEKPCAGRWFMWRGIKED